MNTEHLNSELFLALTRFTAKWTRLDKLDYTKGELGALYYVNAHKDGIYPSELKEKIQVCSGRMADILKSLEDKKLIQRQADKTDNRKTLVWITPKGKSVANQKAKEVSDNLEEMIRCLGPLDTSQFVALLNKLTVHKS